MDILAGLPINLNWWASWWGGLSIWFFGLWSLQCIQRNAVLADLGFCLGLTAFIIGCALYIEGDVLHRLLIMSMATIYALRLGYHFFVYRIYRKAEDHRYQTLRIKWEPHAQAYLFVYFQAQALAILALAFPLCLLMAKASSGWTIWEGMGGLLWIVAILGEAIADAQLEQFRSNPKNRGQTLQQGLWHYSRHPNYFFEGLHWCAYVPMGIGLPYGWLTIINPLLMVGTLLKVSGIPLAEAQALKNRGEGYRQYQQTTNALIPWPPRQQSTPKIYCIKKEK
ncbi:MAG: DUF1295 domain-containing protein [Nitrospirales bacterium]|nr:DUF1295 domain-containing protein [Nitrospirales bacterium]